MTTDFQKCVKDGGQVKKKSLDGKPPYTRVCYPKFGGPAIQEEVILGGIKKPKNKKHAKRKSTKTSK